MATNITDATGKTAHAFLDTDPPHWAARGLAYLIICVFVAVVVASIEIKLPETVTAQFTLMPQRGADPIKAPRNGTIAEVNVKESQVVNRGDVIAIIRSDTAGDQSADLQSFETQQTGAEGSLINAKQKLKEQRRADESQITKLEERVAHQGQTIELKKNQVSMARSIADNYEKLLKQGLTSTNEQTRRQLEINQMTIELEQLEGEQRETRASIERLRNDMRIRESESREHERSLKEEVTKNNIRVNALRDRVAGDRGSIVRVIAPYAGTVLRLHVQGSGALVHEGEVLCELAGASEKLQADLAVPESGVGRLELGQGVKLLYDAFPYQRYGVKGGSLRWIAPTSNSDSFRAVVEIDDESITVNGRPRRLLPGMTGKSEVVVGRRSLISFAFEPIRQLKESLSEAPKKQTASP